MARQRKHRPWMWAATSTAVIAFGVLLLAALPGALGEARRYESADLCDGDGADPPRCREVVAAVVEDVVSLDGGKGDDDRYLDLRIGETATFRPAREPLRIEVEDTIGEADDDERVEPVFDAFAVGDRVEVTYWGRDPVRVTKPGIGSVDTVANPLFDAGVRLALGPLLVFLGGLGWVGAFILRRRSGAWRRKATFATGRRSVAAVVGIGAVFGVTLLVGAAAAIAGTDVEVVVWMWVLGGVAGAAIGGLVAGATATYRRLRA